MANDQKTPGAKEPKCYPPPSKPTNASFKGMPAGQFAKRHPQRPEGSGSNRVFRPMGRGR